MLKRKYLLSTFAILIVISIVAMVLWMYLTTTQSKAVSGILTDEPCAPPCWQGITPGTVVNRHTLVQQLRKTSSIRSVQEDGNTVKWFWNNQRGVNSIYIGQNNVVQSISLQVDFELTVEDIVGKFGPPDAINAAPFGYGENVYILMNLFYPRHGLTCRVQVLPYNHPVLEPHNVVYEVTYNTTAESVDAWFGAQVEDMYLQPWPGYGELEIWGAQQ